MSNIYLIGYRATGKTTVSNLLGRELNTKVIHMDEEITKKIGNIDEFVVKNGWNSFRKKETELLKEISNENDLIVDCGGGIIVKEDNIELMKPGKVFWLKTSPDTIKKRLGKDSQKRPSLTGKPTIEEVDQVLNDRIPLYKRASDYEINTENKSIIEIVEEIIRLK
jgi:shikimate kinase